MRYNGEDDGPRGCMCIAFALIVIIVIAAFIWGGYVIAHFS